MLRYLWNRLGSPHAISLRVWIWSTPIIIFGTALSFGIEVFLQYPLFTILLGITSHLLVGILSWVASLTYLSQAKWDQPRPVRVLLTYISMGSARGILISSFAALSSIPVEPNYIVRIVSSSWIFFFWTTIWTFVVESSERHRQELNDLNLRLQQIQTLQRGRTEAIQSLRSDYLARVERILAPALDKVRGAVDLEELASKIIEPRAYEEIENRIQLAQELREQSRTLSFRDFVRLTGRGGLPAPRVAILAVLSFSVPLILNAPVLGSIHLILTLILIWMAVASQDMNERFPQTLSGSAALLLFMANLILGIWFESQLQTAGLSLASLTLGMWMVALFVISFIALERERRETSVKLKSTLEHLERLQSKLQQELWLERKQLDQLIHSEVQGRLRAAAVLAKLTGSERDLEELKSECIQALSGTRDNMTLPEFTAEMQLLWGRAINLSFNVSMAVESAMERDSYLRNAFFSITREAILNAVKHGSCSFVACVANLAQSQLLRIEISNDGVFCQSGHSGLGTAMIKDLSYSWSLDRQNDLTVLDVWVATNSKEDEAN